MSAFRLPYDVQVQPLNEKEVAVTTGMYVRSGLLGFVGNVSSLSAGPMEILGELAYGLDEHAQRGLHYLASLMCACLSVHVLRAYELEL